MPLPPKFVGSAAGAARAPLSRPGCEAPLAPSPATVSRPAGLAPACGAVRGRGEPSPRKPLLTGPENPRETTSQNPPRNRRCSCLKQPLTDWLC